MPMRPSSADKWPALGKKAAGATLGDPPAVNGIVAVNGARDVPGREGLLATALRRADIDDQK